MCPKKLSQNERNGTHMKRIKQFLVIFILFVIMFSISLPIFAEEKEEEAFDIPDHVLKIAKENTYPNSAEDQEVVEPSQLTKQLIDDVDTSIENPELIKVLNETSLSPSPIGIGYRGMVYLGRWALSYHSLDTTVNWEYQQVNSNELNNVDGDKEQNFHYNQQEEKKIEGALTNKISKPEDVKKMMLLKAKEKTKLPLSYETVIGKNTKKDHPYKVPVKKQGYLHAYAPAVNEKGQVTFGEVYIQLKGTKKSLVIKNVTKQGIGAWIPIQDYLSVYLQLK